MLACIAAVTGVGEGAEGSSQCVVIDPAVDCHEDYVSTESPSLPGAWNLVTPRLSALSENGHFLYSADYGAGDVKIAVRDLIAREVAWEATIDSGADDVPTSLALTDSDRLLVVTAFAVNGSVSRAVTVGIDSSTGAELWRRETQAGPGETFAAALEVVTVDDRIFLMEAFSILDGRVSDWRRFLTTELLPEGGARWQTMFQLPMVVKYDHYMSPPRLSHVRETTGRDLLVAITPGYSSRDGDVRTQMVAVDASTGEIAWKNEIPHSRFLHRAVRGEDGSLVLAGVILSSTGPGWYGMVMRVDPATGGVLWKSAFDIAGYIADTEERMTEPGAIAIDARGFVTVAGRIDDARENNRILYRKLRRDCSDGFIKRFDLASGASAGEVVLPETGPATDTDAGGAGVPSGALCPDGDQLFDLVPSASGETVYAVGRSSDEVGSRILVTAARWPSAGRPSLLWLREFGLRTSKAARANFVALNDSHLVVNGRYELANWERAVTSGGQDAATDGEVFSAALTYRL